MRFLRTWLSAALLAFGCLPSSATAQVLRADVDEFGTQDGIDLWIPASRFMGSGQNGPAYWDCEGFIMQQGYCTNPSADGNHFEALLELPQGAYLDSWRAFFYDDSSENFHIELRKYYDDTSASPLPTYTVISEFTSSGTPGFTNHHQIEGLTIDLREPYTFGMPRAQAADFYAFRVNMPNQNFDVALKGVRVIWHRQVSPSPATATFNDVPTSDPGFQYIEALVASGITAGCNAAPPMYCPDATLTRRQMAVFLAKALGLHWPPF